MGLFWDLIQQNQISEQRAQTQTLESRVNQLEHELAHTRQTLHNLLTRLEEHFGEDLDGDGAVG